MAKRKTDAPAEDAPVAEKKERGANLPPVVKGPKGVPQDAVITFGVDKDGVPYSATEHNPKKEGSKARAKFSLYREGMTIAQALDAGIPTGDLVYDRDHGFVVFTSTSGDGEATEGEGEEQMEEAAD